MSGERAFCPTCGVAFGTPAPMSVGMPPPMAQVTYVQQIQTTSTNGLAIASMVLGIVWVWWIGSILALVFGFVARKQIRERGQRVTAWRSPASSWMCRGGHTPPLHYLVRRRNAHLDEYWELANHFSDVVVYCSLGSTGSLSRREHDVATASSRATRRIRERRSCEILTAPALVHV